MVRIVTHGKVKKDQYISSLDDKDVVEGLQTFMCSIVDHNKESDPVVEDFYTCLDGAIKKILKSLSQNPDLIFPIMTGLTMNLKP